MNTSPRDKGKVSEALCAVCQQAGNEGRTEKSQSGGSKEAPTRLGRQFKTQKGKREGEGEGHDTRNLSWGIFTAYCGISQTGYFPVGTFRSCRLG